MQKKRIAIDMDDVMAATGKKILGIYNAHFGTTLQDEDFKNKSFHEVVHQDNYLVIRDEIFKKGFFADIEVMPDAIEVVKKLHENHEVFIVSAAMEFPNSLQEKYDWLSIHFPFISWKNMVLCGDKSIILADIMIDDHERNLKTFEGQTIMFDALHNQTVEGYVRVKSWKEIETILL